ncbi:dTMP kinase [Clostridium akagii]|uniref:dTMP kinase n=1 Tax=Clostridium akagii TaxID=91623 RepID=UPI00047A0E4A|nr:dTMP kinase [Clostridium akagii]
MRGLLINLEGLDGSGKLTQAKMLKQRLQSLGYEAYVFTYPKYTSKYGEIIKKFLFNSIDLCVEEQFLLHLLDMVRDKAEIKKQLELGNFVILDRYYPSTIAYQCSNGFNFDNAIEIIKNLSLPLPSIVFYLDITPDESSRRKKLQNGVLDRFEKDTKLLKNVSIIYEKIRCKQFSENNWAKIDASKTRVDIHEQLMQAICNRCELSINENNKIWSFDE